jgi:hypothetical protein
MRKSTVALALLALAAVALAIPALSTAGGKVVVTAKLRGASEVPGPGDPNGKGEIDVTLKPAKRKLCFNLEIEKLENAAAAHIHKGAEDVAGPIKVTLFEQDPPVGGTGAYEGCVKNLKRKLLRTIGRKPEKFYANVHNSEYPDGAIRGQLERETVG